MKTIINILVSFLFVYGSDFTSSEFNEWKDKYNKTYDGFADEYDHYKIWYSNKKYIEDRSKDIDFEMELNKFSDNIVNEHHGFNTVLSRKTCKAPFTSSWIVYDQYVSIIDYTLPESVDHRKTNLVTEVKDQGSCGSCWTFSATGSIEGQYAKKYGTLLDFSESQILDCDVDGEDEGCNGGLVDGAFKYLINNDRGLETESAYPYKQEQELCHVHNTRNDTAYVSGYKDVKYTEGNTEYHLKNAVATVGPISVGIDASHTDFQLYKSGVYYNDECSSTSLDHAVLIVGYGNQDGKKYWIVKNSWGPDWGMDGYILMSRDRQNNCGIATQASYPIVE